MTSSQAHSTSNLILDIIDNFRQRPQLYDKKNDDYKINTSKEKAYSEIASAVNKNLPKGQKITEEDVKRKWRNLRKSMTAYLSGKTTKKYYLADKLDFLVPHLDYKKIVKKEKASDEEESEEELSETQKTSALDGDELGDENLQSNKVVSDKKLQNNATDSQSSRTNQSKASKKHQESADDVCEQISQKNGSRKRKSDEDSQKIQSSKTLPAFSKRYIQEKENISALEERTMNLATEAMNAIQHIVKEEEVKPNPYLIAIKQAMTNVPQQHLLECSNGVLVIIDEFLKP
ncbi:hypothetical protein QAD02_009559 [Eretmocerus hayati]|uniref:Uncharacterized protein n=1 Tax=Eretmocerus hayati TaxID=131215 RepID=A0ACC2NA06_9HYME|nr:hypothetical protein QAD02_009559 [Eretmocerus hayati]